MWLGSLGVRGGLKGRLRLCSRGAVLGGESGHAALLDVIGKLRYLIIVGDEAPVAAELCLN
jgi:hypothetical protein